jgi:hypothetical protein
MTRVKTARPPVWFFQPESRAGELMAVYDKFSQEADNKSGVPNYSYGGSGDKGGAISTATGMSMMMSNAARGIKHVVGNIDEGIIEPSVMAEFEFMMLFEPDPQYQGDVRIVAQGSKAALEKEQQQVRRLEFLNILLHPTILQIIGLPGLAYILREIGGGMGMDADDFIPSPEDIERAEQIAQMMQQQQQQPPALPPGAGPGQSPELAPDGAQMGGRDEALFNQGGNLAI